MTTLFRIFKTSKNHYLYDTKSNRITHIPDITYNKLKKIQKKIDEGVFIPNIHKYLTTEESNELKSLGVTEDINIKKVLIYPPNYTLERAISSDLKHLVLEVTRDCNCRCDYCIYGGGYFYQKTHAPLRMKEEVMKRAISIFIDASKNIPNPLISFAGGEPFLEYSSIKNTIDFVNSWYKKNVRFFVNTNGTLLNERRLDYLAENNVELRFSIDGPMNIHDRHRKTMAGAPTYDKVMESIQYLYRNYRDYYKRYVSFSVVLSEPSQIDEVFQFFYSNPMFKDAEKIFSSVNPDNRRYSYYSHIPQKMSNSLKKLYEQYVRLWILEENPAKSLLHFSFGKLLLQIHNRALEKIDENSSPGDCCIPVVHRLICKVDGQFGFCDKDAYAWNIGDVYTGINKKRLNAVVKDYCSICASLCKNCWAMRFCRACFSFASEGDNFSINKIKKICNAMKMSVDMSLRMYAEIMESNPNAFERFNNRCKI